MIRNIIILVVLMVETAQCQPLGVVDCEVYYQIIQDTGMNSATATTHQNVTDQLACQAICDAALTCSAYSWDGTTCQTYNKPDLNLTPEAGTTQYLKLWRCERCFLICYVDKAIGAGSVHTVENPSACLSTCLDTPSCEAFEVVSLTDCRLYTAATDKPLSDLTDLAVTHCRIIFCATPAPCNGPPVECFVNTGSTCGLPAGSPCGIGASTEEWTCSHGIPFHPKVFQMSRDCCTIPCPAGTPCSQPQTVPCTAGTFNTETKCFGVGCCWVSGSCLEDTRNILLCGDVAPGCDP